MPIMEVSHPAGALDGDRKRLLAERLTDVLLQMEGGAATSGGRGFATVVFHAIPDGDWWVGGRCDDTHVAPPGRFLVHVTIPEGYMNQVHKTEVHTAVTEAIVAVVDPSIDLARDPTAAASIQVILDEVTEGDWGAGARTISLAHIADVVGLPKDGERFRWVEAFFAAKARQYAAAGYPTDCGGLLPAPVDH